MKANRKFRSEDDAVSPVIAVILMVAITVVLSATVYVWVSGFGARTTQPARAVNLVSDGPLANGFRNYTLSSADSSLRYGDVAFTLDGATLNVTGTCAAPAAGNVTLCRGTTPLNATFVASAGDRVMISAAAGQTFRVIDLQANSVLFTGVVG